MGSSNTSHPTNLALSRRPCSQGLQQRPRRWDRRPHNITSLSPQWNLQSVTMILHALASVFISQAGSGALPHVSLFPHLYLPPDPGEKAGHLISPAKWPLQSVSCLLGSMASGGSPPRAGGGEGLEKGKGSEVTGLCEKVLRIQSRPDQLMAPNPRQEATGPAPP